MERESFESQAVANVLNEHFVSIKASAVGSRLPFCLRKIGVQQ